VCVVLAARIDAGIELQMEIQYEYLRNKCS